MLGLNRVKELPLLIQELKELDVNKIVNKDQLLLMAQAIFEQLTRVKTRYRHKVKSDAYKKLFENYIAEEEIITGLLFLLQEKLMDALFK